MKTFKHDFGKGVTCEIEVTDSPPSSIPDSPASGHILSAKWTGSRTDKMIPQYIAWINSVNKQLADEWDVKMMHVFDPPNGQMQAWLYEPGQNPRRMNFGAVDK